MLPYYLEFGRSVMSTQTAVAMQSTQATLYCQSQQLALPYCLIESVTVTDGVLSLLDQTMLLVLGIHAALTVCLLPDYVSRLERV